MEKPKERKIRKIGKTIHTKIYDRKNAFQMIADFIGAIHIVRKIPKGKVSLTVTQLIEEVEDE